MNRNPTNNNEITRTLAAVCGLASIVLFGISFLVCSMLNPQFDFVQDYISKLGSADSAYSLYWNSIGFGVVGVMLAVFGLLFGLAMHDRILGACLVVSGIGFALAAVPANFENAQSPLSKAHYVAVCLSLGGWCLGLARLLRPNYSDTIFRTAAWYAVVLAILPLVGVGSGISGEPISHRFVLLIAFGWITAISTGLLTSRLESASTDRSLGPVRD